jgi:hypothetical protein
LEKSLLLDLFCELLLPPSFFIIIQENQNECTPPSLCGSPFQTIECEEGAAAIPSVLADTAWLEKSASLGEVVRLLLRHKLLSRTWIGVRAPLTGTRLKNPSFFIEGEELRVFRCGKGRGGSALCSGLLS